VQWLEDGICGHEPPPHLGCSGDFLVSIEIASGRHNPQFAQGGGSKVVTDSSSLLPCLLLKRTWAVSNRSPSDFSIFPEVDFQSLFYQPQITLDFRIVEVNL
jgi:hypothetical protein